MEKDVEKNIVKDVDGANDKVLDISREKSGSAPALEPATNPTPTHNTLLKKTGSSKKKIAAIAVCCFLVGGALGVGGTLAVQRFVLRPHMRSERFMDYRRGDRFRNGQDVQDQDGQAQNGQPGQNGQAPDNGNNGNNGAPGGQDQNSQVQNGKNNKARANRSTNGGPGNRAGGSREDGKTRFREAAQSKRAERDGQNPAGNDQQTDSTTGGGANEN